MSNRPLIVFGIFAAICLIAIPFYAIAKEGDEGLVKVAEEDVEARDLFANNCGTCHTLAAGGTDGVVGPDLDDLLVPTGVNSSEQFSGLYQRVLNAVTCGIGGRMPRRILIGEEAKDVAAFAAAYAGQIDKDPTVDLVSAEKADPEPCPTPGGDESAGSAG